MRVIHQARQRNIHNDNGDKALKQMHQCKRATFLNKDYERSLVIFVAQLQHYLLTFLFT